MHLLINARTHLLQIIPINAQTTKIIQNPHIISGQPNIKKKSLVWPK